MSRFVTKRPTSRIELGDGDWVDIWTQLTFGEREVIRKQMTAGARGPDGEVIPDRLDHLAANRELLLRAIVAWGGAGFCERDEHPHDGECQPRGITAANVDALDTTGERVLGEIVDRQVTSTPGLKGSPASSTATASSSQQDSAAATTSSDASTSSS